MNHPDLELFSDSGIASHLSNEQSAESRDTISVKQMKSFGFIDVVVDNTVSIPVQRAAAIEWSSIGAWRSSLPGLDEIGTALGIALACAGIGQASQHTS